LGIFDSRIWKSKDKLLLYHEYSKSQQEMNHQLKQKKPLIGVFSGLMNGRSFLPATMKGYPSCLSYIGEISTQGYGLDPSLEMIRHALGSNLDLIQAKGEMIPFTSSFFDLVFSKDVIHHIEDIAAYFREVFRVLVPGGLICTATDSEEQIMNRRPLSEYWPGSAAVDLKRYPMISKLKELMYRAGFSEITQTERQMSHEIKNLTPYRERAFSCLHLISDKEYTTGLETLERDFRAGPIFGLVQYTFVLGCKTKS